MIRSFVLETGKYRPEQGQIWFIWVCAMCTTASLGGLWKDQQKVRKVYNCPLYVLEKSRRLVDKRYVQNVNIIYQNLGIICVTCVAIQTCKYMPFQYLINEK